MTTYVDGASQKTRMGAIVDGLVSGLSVRVKAGIKDEAALRKKLKTTIATIVEMGEDEVLTKDPKALIKPIEELLTTLLGAVEGDTVKELAIIKTVVRTLSHEAYDLGKATK